MRRAAITLVSATMLFALVGCSQTPSYEEVGDGIDCVKEIFEANTSKELKKTMPVEKSDSGDFTLDHPFYSTDGTYCIFMKDETVNFVVFTFHDDVDSDDVIEDIEKVLGEPTSYDYEEDCSEWETPWLDVSFSPDDGIWFELTGSIPTCDNTGHGTENYTEWDIDYADATMTRNAICSECGYVTKTETEEVTSFVNGDCFSLYPAGFAKRFDEKSISGIDGYTFDSDKVENEGKLFYDKSNIIYYSVVNEDNNDSSVGMYQFLDSSGTLVPISEDYTENNFAEIDILIDKTSDVSAVVFATVMAIDPGLSYDACAEIGQRVIDNVGKKKGVTNNSINYSLLKKSNKHYLIVKVA